MRLFAVLRTAPMFDAMAGGALVEPAHAVSLLGKAVHVSSAARAMRVAINRLGYSPSPSRPLRYASACSGVDMLGVALQCVAHRFPEFAGAPDLRSTVSFFKRNLKSQHCITKRKSQLFHDLAVALEHTCLGECPVIVDDPILA